MNITIFQPYRPDTPDALHARAIDLAHALAAATPEHVITMHRVPGAARPGIGPEKYAPHADVRNQLIDALPADLDYVLWIDVDLVSYPADFVRRALAINPNGITAPWVLLEHTATFYDIGGFIEIGGRPFDPQPPYTREAGNVIDLESVGCLYLAPASLYRDPIGARYAPTGPVYGVEHWSVCTIARAHGMRVVADRTMVAQHAYLPRYGKPLN